MDILFYADSRGCQPVYDWLENLKKREPKTFRKAYLLLKMLEENGELIRSGTIKRDDIKKLKNTDDIWQLRINENRVLFFYFTANSIVLTNNFKKKRQSTPHNEIVRAENRRKDWINRNQ